MAYVWDQDAQVLAELADRYLPGNEEIPVHELLVGRPEDEQAAVKQSLRRLRDAGYIQGKGTRQTEILRITAVTERGLRETGAWPSTEAGVERLIAALEAAAAAEPDPGKSRKLQMLVTAARDLGVGTLAQILGGGFLAGTGLS